MSKFVKSIYKIDQEEAKVCLQSIMDCDFQIIDQNIKMIGKLQKIYEVVMTPKQETLYSCKRVWSAWSYGTMTEDDFEEVEPSCMIGDVLDRRQPSDDDICCNRFGANEFIETILSNWIYLRKPIDDQPEECIDYVFELIEYLE